MRTTIVCGIDVGPAGRDVLDATVEISRRADARVLVVHAGTTNEAHLWAVEEALRIDADMDVDVCVEPGRPPNVVAGAARRSSAILVVVGASSSRWSGVPRALRRRLSAPLLVVRDATWLRRWSNHRPLRVQSYPAGGETAAVRRWASWLASLGPAEVHGRGHEAADIAVADAGAWHWWRPATLQDPGCALLVEGA